MVNNLVLPSIEFYTLDVLKVLLNVADALSILLPLLISYVFANFFAFVAHEKLNHSEH